MGLGDIGKGLLFVIGAGIIAERFKAGPGLAGLGGGIREVVSAPGMGVGLGLTGTATGIRDIAESFGDIGRGLAAIFGSIPKMDPFPGNGYIPPKYEHYVSSGDATLKSAPTTALPASNGQGNGTDSGIFRDPRYAGSPWTFVGAKTLWHSQESALKNYNNWLQESGYNV